MSVPLEMLALLVALAAAIVGIFLRIENRLTRIETRVCALPCLTGGCKEP